MPDSPPQRAFISYVREDADDAAELQSALEAAGIDVWIDKAMLFPGQDWKLEIRRAIEHGSLAFIPIFSTNSAARATSVQNDELLTAAEAFALRPVGSQWMFPVRLGDVDVPELDLGGRRTLRSIHYTDLYGRDRTANLIRLVTSLAKVVRPTASASSIAAQISSSDLPNGDPQRIGQVKTLMRDPNGDIALEELIEEMARDVQTVLNDSTRFPLNVASDDDSTLAWVERVEALFTSYEEAVKPIAQVLMLAGRWGREEQEFVWKLAIQPLAETLDRQEAHQFLRRLRHYPLVYLTHVATLAAMGRDNFGVVRSAIVEPTATDPRLDEPLSIVAYANLATITGGGEGWIFQALSLFADGVGERTVDYVDMVRAGRVRGRHEPLSDYLESRLWSLFESQFQNRARFEVAFDEAEILLDALWWDTRTAAGMSGRGIGGGRYTYRYEYVDSPPDAKMLAASEAEQGAWMPLTAGLFGRDPERAKSALSKINENAARTRGSRW